MVSLSSKLFFSWLEAGKLAALAWPGTKSAIEFLRSENIRHLVSLTLEPPSLHGVTGLKNIHIPVQNYTPPTVEQVLQFMNITERAHSNNEAVAVHCQYGCGRTGTMLACYLVKANKCTWIEAVEQVRQMRPGSVERPDQEDIVKTYEKLLLKQTTV